MNLQTELDALAKAEEDIRLADERISGQVELTRQLRLDGHDASLATELLSALQETRLVMLKHRDLIIQSVERLRTK